MSPITTSTEIDCPATEVFAYATDPTRFSSNPKLRHFGRVPMPLICGFGL